jgi:hypothetical protein
MFSWKKRPEVVIEFQSAFSLPMINISRARDALAQLVNDESWQACEGKDGNVFSSFATWLTADIPHGGGVRDQESAEKVRDMLFENGDYRCWGETLELITRSPGHPGQTKDPDKFYRVTTATTGKDRMLLRLMRDRPDHYEALCNGEYDNIRAAATAAGLITKAAAHHACLATVTDVFPQLRLKQQLEFLVTLVSQLDQPARDELEAKLRDQDLFSS